jgi:hypothetical protein
MDLVLWVKEGEEFFPVAAELWKDPKPELLIIPSIFENATFGASYVYYSGGTADLPFEVQFIDLINQVAEPEATRDIFTATYTAANINKYDTSGKDWIIEQTFDLIDGDITNFSEILVPADASRIKTKSIPAHLKKGKTRLNAYSKGL